MHTGGTANSAHWIPPARLSMPGWIKLRTFQQKVYLVNDNGFTGFTLRRHNDMTMLYLWTLGMVPTGWGNHQPWFHCLWDAQQSKRPPTRRCRGPSPAGPDWDPTRLGFDSFWPSLGKGPHRVGEVLWAELFNLSSMAQRPFRLVEVVNPQCTTESGQKLDN